MTGVMGSFILGFTLLALFAPLCLGASYIQRNIMFVAGAMNWTNARQYCQKYNIDLIPANTVSATSLVKTMTNLGYSKLWLGLHRDPLNDTVWKSINVRTGIGITGDDLSNSDYWSSGQQSSLCAYVNSDLMWYSDLCSNDHYVYCSQGTYIQYYNYPVTWDMASEICKSYNMSLATIITHNDYINNGWIGLYRVGDKEWKWTGYQSYPYTNWASGEPSTPDCVSLSADTAHWYSDECSNEFYIACTTDNLVVVKENKTWEEAQSYCSNMTANSSDSSYIYRYRLLILQTSEDYSYARDRIYSATTDEVWIGLRFLGGTWWWIDGQVEDDQNCSSLSNNCGSLSKNGAYNWTANDCIERKNFVCYKYKSLIM